MGILNVTPDSFSDGGKYFSPEEALRRAANMSAEGADILDVGGESTRPGALPLDWKTEWSRIEGIVRALAPRAFVSVDTYHPETAREAVRAGARMVNCVSAQTAREMAAICAASGVDLVVPAGSAKALGVSPRRGRGDGWTLYADPMVGFGTTREEDLELLGSIPSLAASFPVAVGASRKRIVKKLTGEKRTGKNLGGSLAVALWCALKGASIVRVHDVAETVQALKAVKALEG